MTKSRNIFLALLLAVFFLCGTAPSFAALYQGPIVMVTTEDVPSTDVNLTITTLSLQPGWVVGEWLGGSFSQFTDDNLSLSGIQVTKPGGQIVDLAIQSATETFRLSEEIHGVDFINENTGVVREPKWVTTWYNDANIYWANNITFSIVSTGGDSRGLAPVPIPGALLLLGSGLIGFIGLRRKLGAKR